MYIYDHHIYMHVRVYSFYIYVQSSNKNLRVRSTHILLLAAYSKMYFNIKTNH